jgi:hypothetical protein
MLTICKEYAKTLREREDAKNTLRRKVKSRREGIDLI